MKLCRLIWVFLILVISGCATSRGVLDVPVDVPENPGSGPLVFISQVTDSRGFERAPPRPEIPSLKKADQIDDPAITSRAIARKRNGYGKAMGDILLAEGSTVTGIVRDSITKGLRENGYRVVAESESMRTKATPLAIDIRKFWGWFQPGMWTIKVHYESDIVISGPLAPFDKDVFLTSKVERKSGAATTKTWLNIIDTNLAALNEDIAAKLGSSE